MAKQSYAGPATALARFEAVVAAHDGVERKGAKMPYTSANGKMFSFLDEDGVMALRLPPSLRDEFLARYKTSLVEQHGRTMKDFVAVPERLLRKPVELATWFKASADSVAGAKPKPTTRPKKR